MPVLGGAGGSPFWYHYNTNGCKVQSLLRKGGPVYGTDHPRNAACPPATSGRRTATRAATARWRPLPAAGATWARRCWRPRARCATGAGLVFLATVPQAMQLALARCPECCVLPCRAGGGRLPAARRRTGGGRQFAPGRAVLLAGRGWAPGPARCCRRCWAAVLPESLRAGPPTLLNALCRRRGPARRPARKHGADAPPRRDGPPDRPDGGPGAGRPAGRRRAVRRPAPLRAWC